MNGNRRMRDKWPFHSLLIELDQMIDWSKQHSKWERYTHTIAPLSSIQNQG